MKSMISENIARLRTRHRYTLEQLAERLGVTRQAVAKWESGATLPDLENCQALADLFGVSVDDLLRYDVKTQGVEMPPKGKHIFGVVTVGERGQIVIPKRAREIFGIQAGDTLLVLGDEDPERAGIALVRPQQILPYVDAVLGALKRNEGED